jgi:hypothetical protein
MISGLFRGPKTLSYEEKPIQLVGVAERMRIIALVLLVPKRGGAVKALLLSNTENPKTLRELLVLAERRVIKARKRKLYFIHPIEDNKALSSLAKNGYTAEGILRSPYREGQDAVVYSRFFNSTADANNA